MTSIFILWALKEENLTVALVGLSVFYDIHQELPGGLEKEYLCLARAKAALHIG